MNNNAYIDSNNNIIAHAIMMIEHLNEPWGIKDKNSHHVYMNKAALKFTNTPQHFAFEGKKDSEFPTQWSELADDFVQHDNLTANTNRSVRVIETHYWNGNKCLTPYISEKIPLLNSQRESLGILWNAKELIYINPLININKRNPTVVTTEIKNTQFNKKELNVIFLVLQNLSYKEIANILNIAPRTVESRLKIIFKKTEVHSLYQLKGYCSHIGLDNYVPDSFLCKGLHFITK
ncbi:helix-turn-helix transcriptional regulator [Arsenophonus nasoniae]|uniref:helix-turn-helix transcriptional regulator n=1 Tax=Arsenophonus nasoniae TaxID=638 RepID=UPI003879035F